MDFGNERNFVRKFLEQALSEDLGRGDLFALVSEDRQSCAHIVAKQGGVFSGEWYVRDLCALVGVSLEFYFTDSQNFEKGAILGSLHGGYLKILQIERVLLNILSHSSGIATKTQEFVRALDSANSHLSITLLDTRKTRPLLRALEKYSVRNGGAQNHRFGLDSLLMLKDTHLAHIADLRAFVAQARKKLPWGSKIEIEVPNLQKAREAFEAGADIVMCDNMSAQDVREVADLRDSHFPHILLEASGNLTLQNLATYAKSGVNALSIGALIHQATWIDLSLQMQ
ncbi:carboxylating nicotinate-nucleotide diphosphorylase [Helicobacter himalayensis]|uniref:carboxylating nicotinate-nucleotide diphosphorylase n=1 Tax=Helicobacter himalayensis TaxID=1591088 RepID=UPI003D6FE545